MKLNTDQVLGVIDAVLGRTNKTARFARKKASAIAEELTENSRHELIRVLNNLQKKLEPKPSATECVVQFSVGLLVGVGIGMLVAPESAIRLRRRMTRSNSNLSNVVSVPRSTAI